MKIHEYQGKDLFRRYGIAVPTGGPCLSIEEADAASTPSPPPGVWVIKAQIHAAAEAKGGGVHIAKTPARSQRSGPSSTRHGPSPPTKPVLKAKPSVVSS